MNAYSNTGMHVLGRGSLIELVMYPKEEVCPIKLNKFVLDHAP